MSTPEEIDALKLADLKTKCKELGLSTTGNKAELATRLKEALFKEGATQADAAGADAADPGEAVAEEEANGTGDADTAAATAEAAEEPQPGAGKHQAITFDEALASSASAKVEVVNAAKAEPAQGQTTVVSDADRLKKRAERFADPATTKLKERAQRFGLSHPDIDKEKKMERARKFGTLNPDLELEKRKQRAERFGIVDEETKKKQRLEKFKPLPSTDASKPGAISANNEKGDAEFEEKKNARALRFAVPS